MADGVFYAELNELLNRELAEDGYSGVEVRVTPMRTEIIIKATRTQNVLGEQLQPLEEHQSAVYARHWALCSYLRTLHSNSNLAQYSHGGSAKLMHRHSVAMLHRTTSDQQERKVGLPMKAYGQGYGESGWCGLHQLG